MARTWIEKREPFVPSLIAGYQKRDQLAQDLIDLMESNSAEAEEYIEALQNARAVINEPFRRGEFVGTARFKEFKKAKAESPNGNSR